MLPVVANFTLEQSLLNTLVSLQMRLEIAFNRESLPAQRAVEWFLLSVHSLVLHRYCPIIKVCYFEQT